ncbi:MAG: BamA/TamA family outer membrane protein [Deltaproteobacteria bacterium]|nr:BamA/TamA family outer membrane protein [Deltaproteobacteria bacterium]
MWTPGPVIAVLLTVFAATAKTRAAPPDVPAPAASGDGEGAAPGDGGASALDDWSVIPILFYTPETSLGFGVAVIHSFDASSGPSPLSTLGAGVIVTAEEQLILRLQPDVRFDDALLQGAVRFQRYPTRFFGPDADPDDEGEPFDELAFWSTLDARYRLGRTGTPWEAVSVGARCDVHWNEVTAVEDGGRLAREAPLGVDPLVGLGCGPVVAWDTRDDVRLPSRGALIEARVMAWTALYGDPFIAAAGEVDVRGYLELGAGHVLAGHLRVRTVAGELPFQLLPRLGGSNEMRGWFEGHLRARSTFLAQLEWRLPLFWKLGAAVFASAGQAFPRWRDFGWDGMRFAGGAGLRYLLNVRQSVRVRFDVAWGSDLAAYVDVLESF